MELAELKTRRALADAFTRELSKVDDPRRDEVLVFYRAQVVELDAEITRLEREARQARGEPEPEPVVVGLKPAQLFGKAQ